MPERTPSQTVGPYLHIGLTQGAYGVREVFSATVADAGMPGTHYYHIISRKHAAKVNSKNFTWNLVLGAGKIFNNKNTSVFEVFCAYSGFNVFFVQQGFSMAQLGDINVQVQ